MRHVSRDTSRVQLDPPRHRGLSPRTEAVAYLRCELRCEALRLMTVLKRFCLEGMARGLPRRARSRPSRDERAGGVTSALVKRSRFQSARLRGGGSHEAQRIGAWRVRVRVRRAGRARPTRPRYSRDGRGLGIDSWGTAMRDATRAVSSGVHACVAVMVSLCGGGTGIDDRELELAVPAIPRSPFD
jgi:hypothetical protein